MSQNNKFCHEYEEEIQQLSPEEQKEIDSVTIVLGDDEYILNNKKIFSLFFPLFSKSKNNKSNVCILPKNIEKIHFEFFLNFIEYLNSTDHLDPTDLKNIDFYSLRQVIEISLFFNAVDIIDFLSQQFLLPKIKEDTCLEIIEMFKDLTQGKVRKIFSKVIEQCLICASHSLIDLYNTKHEKLLSMDENILEEIIEMNFKSFSLKNEDFEKVLSIMFHIRKNVSDLYELIESERKNALLKFEDNYNENKNTNTFVWDVMIDDNNKGYQEEKITFDNITILLIIYYDSQKDVFNLAFQLVDIQKPIFLEKRASYNDDSYSEDMDEKTYDILNNRDTNGTSVVSFLSLCEIKEVGFKSKINFNCVYTNSKSRVLIFKIENFLSKYGQLAKKDGISFEVKLSLSRDYIFSNILDYLCKNFQKYKNMESINKLPKIVLNLIIKNQYLNYKYEQDILDTILIWLCNKSASHITSSIDLFNKVNWSLIPTDSLVDFLMYNNKIISLSPELMKIIYLEIQKRFQTEYSRNHFPNDSYSVSESCESKFDTENKSNIFYGVSSTNNNNINNTKFTLDFLNRILYNCSKLENGYTSNYIPTRTDKAINLTSPKNENNISLPNKGVKTSKNKLSQHNISKSSSNNAYFSNYLIKKVTKHFIAKNERNYKQNLPTTEKASRILNSKTSSISQNNSSISFQMTNNQIQQPSQINTGSNTNANSLKKKPIDKSIINKIVYNRANTPDDFNKKTKSQSKKNSRMSSNGRSHSKSIDRTVQSSTVRSGFNANATVKQINSIYPKYIHSVNNSSTNSSKHNLMSTNKEKVPFSKNQNFFTNITARNGKIKDPKGKVTKIDPKIAALTHMRSRSNY